MGQFVARKMPVEQWFSYICASDMAKNCPRYIPDMPKICASFARGVEIQIEKVGQNVAGESASVGTLCRRGGARCSGTLCRWDILSPNQRLLIILDHVATKCRTREEYYQRILKFAYIFDTSCRTSGPSIVR